MEKKKPKWYEPYSSFRKFLWYLNLVCALVNAPGIFLADNQKLMLTYGFYTIFNLFVCWISFDRTFKIVEEDNEK